MKNVKRLVAFAVVIAMVIAFAPADSGVVLAAKTTKKVKTVTKFKAAKNMTFTDKNVKDLSKALKSKKVKTITLNLKKTKNLTIPKGDFSTKKLIVNSPKTSIENKATFDTIRIDSIAPDTWTETGSGNSIFVLSNKSVHIKVNTNRRVASIMFGDEAKANLSGLENTKKSTVKHFVEMINGALSRLVDSSKNEIVMEASGDSSVGSIDVEAAGANMTLNATGEAHIHNMDISESAGSPNTKVGVTVEGNATVDNLKTSAEGATLNVATSDSGAVGLKIVGGGSATLTGTSTRQSVVDVSEADPAKGNVTIENNNAKLETAQGQDVSTIVENKTGKELDKQVKSDNTDTSSDKPVSGTGKKPGQGGGSGGSGGGDGGSEAATVSVPADPGNLIRDAGFVSGNYQGYWEGNILSDFGATGNASLGGGKAVFTVTNPGTEDYAVQLCQKNITLKHGAKYKLTGKITSDKAKSIGIAFMDPNQNYLWYGGTDTTLNAGETYNINLPFTVDKATVGGAEVTCETSNTIQFAISMGKKGTTPDNYTVTVSDLRLEMVEDAPVVDPSSDPSNDPADDGIVVPDGYTKKTTEKDPWGPDTVIDLYGPDLSDLTGYVDDLSGKKLTVKVKVSGFKETKTGVTPKVLLVLASGGSWDNWTESSLNLEEGKTEYDLELPFDIAKGFDRYRVRFLGEGLTVSYQLGAFSIVSPTVTESNLLVRDSWNENGSWGLNENNKAQIEGGYKFTLSGEEGPYANGLVLSGNSIKAGKKYEYTFDVKSSITRRFNISVEGTDYTYARYDLGVGDFDTDANTKVEHKVIIDLSNVSSVPDVLSIKLFMGKCERELAERSFVGHTVEITNMKLVEVTE